MQRLKSSDRQLNQNKNMESQTLPASTRLSGNFRRFLFTLLVLLSFSTSMYAQEEDEILAAEEMIENPVEPAELNIPELCKTPEGQKVLLRNRDDYGWRDLKEIWLGMAANNQTTAKTFEEFQTEHVKSLCSDPIYAIPGYQFRPFRVAGTCDDLRFEAPYYDVNATVEEAQRLNSYYLSSNDLSFLSPTERIQKRDAAIKQLLTDKETEMKYYYSRSGCHMGQSATCYMHHFSTKKICGETYITAPANQRFVRESVKARGSVKSGPTFESDTRLSFRVGSSTMGEEKKGSVEVRTLFTETGAKDKAVRDVDVVRLKFIELGLPIDKQPQVIVKPPIRPQIPRPEPKPSSPARMRWTFRPYRKPVDNKYMQYAELFVTNVGGTATYVNYEIAYLDGFFTTIEPKWKCKLRTQIYLKPGETYKGGTWIEFHALDWSYNKIDETNRLIACF